MKNFYFKKGFTLVEVLIVLSILIMASLAVMISFGGARNQIVLEGGGATLVSALEKARNQSVAGVGESINELHGICIEGQEIFTCKKKNQNDLPEKESEPIELPSSISVKEPSFNEDIIFNRISGTTTSTTIIIEHTSGIKKTITINEQGKIISQ